MSSDSMKMSKSESEQYDLWGRVGCVEIDLGKNSSYTGGKPLRFTDLDFKFKVTKVIGDFPDGTVEVSILGLTQNTINQIVTICDQQAALEMGKRIRVFAGYKDMGNGSGTYVGEKIIEADIAYAKVDTPPPEMWLSIVGVIGYRNRFQQVNVSYPDAESVKNTEDTVTRGNMWDQLVWNVKSFFGGLEDDEELIDASPESLLGETALVKHSKPPSIKFKDLCQKVVEVINALYIADKFVMPRVELDYRSENNPDITEFTSTGNVSDLIGSLRQCGDFYVFLDNDRDASKVERLVVVDRPKDITKDNYRNMINLGKSKVRIKNLNQSTGLIGIPSVAGGVSLHCRMLLDPRLTAGDYINLTSQVMPAANGDQWQIMKITHSGHFRGNEWYTDVEAVDNERLCANQKAQQDLQKKVDLAINGIDASIGTVDVRDSQ